MLARHLATPQLSVRPTDTFVHAIGTMGQGGAILVVDDHGSLVGVLSGADLLRGLLPVYLQADEQLAGVLDEELAEKLFERVKNRLVSELLRRPEELPQVSGDSSLIEVASVMVRTASPLLAVVDGGVIVGGISLAALLDRLAR